MNGRARLQMDTGQLKKEVSSMRVQHRLSHCVITLAVVLCMLGLGFSQGYAQLAKGKGKFIGNALSSGIPIWSNYKTYWNQVSPGNAGKWGSVEGFVHGSYDWTWLDNLYAYALDNSLPFKEHCLIWGAQQPTNWIDGLDSAQQRAAVEKWIDTLGARYPSMAMVDVVNEPFHQPPSYKHALGDSGATGWDWVVTAFSMARNSCMRGVKLMINEYSVIHDNTITTRYLALIDTLRVRNLIDAIGVQGHTFELFGSGYAWTPSALKFNLDRLAATGLPVYITEFDINEANDSIQLAMYQKYFPVFWENSGVKGITFWGYMQGDMWQTNAYLVRSDGSERPALQWLRRYIASPLPPVLVSPKGTTGELRNPGLVWHSSTSATSYHVQVSATSRLTSFVVDTTVADTLIQLLPLSANTMHFWRVSAANDSGTSSYSPVASFTTGDLIQAVEENQPAPMEFALLQNYPNPFNPETTIGYTVGVVSSQSSVASTWVRLSVYDLLGREIAVLVNEAKHPGDYHVKFDGAGLTSGVYICRMSAGTNAESEKMLLLK